MTYLRLLLVVLLTINYSLFTDFSFAQSKSNTIRVAPAYVEVALENPGDEKDIEFTFTNNGKSQTTLEMFPIDFRQTNPFGAIGFVGQDVGSYSYSLSSFLLFDTDRLILEPGESKKFVLHAKNREDMSPGGHYAALVARQVIEGAGDTTVAPALSSLIYLRKVGGERFNLSIKDSNWPRLPIVFDYPKEILLTFQNEGNIHLFPFGRLEVKNIFGNVVADGVINEASLRVMPESRRFIPVTITRLSKLELISLNTLFIKGYDSYEKTTFVFQDSFLYVNPVFLLLLLGGVIVAVRKIVIKVKNRKK